MLYQSGLEKKFNEVKDSPDSVQIQFPGFQVSHSGLWSKDYRDSVGVAIIGETVYGLTNYSLSNRLPPPEVYIPQVLEQLRATEQQELGAVVIGGNKIHFDRVINVLLSQIDVSVGDTYLDIISFPKDLVIASTGHVIMYSHKRGEDNQGYMQLFSIIT